MKTRIITSVVAAPVAVLFFLLGGMAMQIFVTLIIMVGLFELYRAFNKKWVPVYFVGYSFALIYMAFIQTFREGNGYFLFFTFFILVVMTVLVLFNKKVTVQDCAVTILGFFYVCLLMSTLFLVREIEELGIFMVWMVCISAWGSDTGAYFVGINFGKRKLAPTLSPKKSVEGAIGGVVVVTLISALYGFILTRFSSLEMPLVLPFAIIGAGASVLSMIGDLSASAIKRSTGIKDFGSIFPGHGGLLDRFDSVLFTAPSVYLLTVLWISFGNL